MEESCLTGDMQGGATFFHYTTVLLRYHFFTGKSETSDNQLFL